MPGFRGDSIAELIITELDADGATLAGGHQYRTKCNIDSVEWENLQDDAEDIDIANANVDCKIKYRRPAKKYGKIVRIGTVGTIPEIDNILTGAPLNINGSGDIVGTIDTDYKCKNVAVELFVKPITGACSVGSEGYRMKLFPRIEQFAITQDETYTNSNEVPVVIYEGVAYKNPNYDDPDGRWDGTPSYWDADAYASSAIYTGTLPSASDDFVVLPGGSSS